MGICPICESSHRHQIEVDLLNGDPLEEIMSKCYGRFSMDQLKIHAVSHLKMEHENNESIATRLAVKEADALSQACAEYMATLKRVGVAIESQIASVESGEITVGQALSKSLVDLYLGTGNQIRENVKLLMDAERDMNAGEAEGSNVSSIRRLTEAIERSRKAV